MCKVRLAYSRRAAVDNILLPCFLSPKTFSQSDLGAAADDAVVATK